MTTLLKKDYGYSNVLWEDVIGRVKEIIRDEYNISPYISPELNTSINSPFRVWIDGQETNQFATSNWYKEYSISINQYFKVEKNVNFYKRVYQDAERLYEIFFHNMGSYDVTTTTYKVKFYNAKPESVDISQEGEYFRIELIYNLIVNRDDNEVYIISSPSTVRAKTRAIEKPYNFWSLDFDGSDDSVNCGSDSSLDDIFDGGGSVSVWFNSSAINATHTIVSKKGGGTGYWAIRISDNSGNTGRFYFIKSFDSSHYTTQQSTRDINANTWYHAVVVYNADSDSNRITAYLNGEVITNLVADGSGPTSAPSGTRISDASQDFYIGKDNQYEFLGQISEVSLFNTELTSSAISSMYNNGQPILLTENQGSYKSSSNLVAYYRMGSGEGDVRGSGGLVADQVDSSVGAELIDDPTFADADNTTDSTWGKWRSSGDFEAIADSVATFSSNTLNMTSAAGTPGIGEKDFATIISGRMYKITCEITSYTSGYVAFTVGNSSSSDNNGTASQGSGGYSSYFNTTGTVEQYILTSNDDPPKIWKHDGTGFTGSIKNFSVKLLSGNPGALNNFDGLDFRTNVPQIYDKALFSNSLVFDGTDDYIDLSEKTTSLQSNGFTFAAWIYPHDLSNTQFLISGDSNDNNIRFNGNGYQLFVEINNKGTTIGTWSSDSDGVFVINQWQHLVVTYDNGTVTIYRNGNPVTFDTGGTTYSTDTGATEFKYRHIGKRYGVASYYDGGISDMAIYNTDLDATNVTAMYNSGKPIDLTCDAGNYNNANNLVAYWKMGDGYLDELPSDINGGVIIDQINPIIGDELFNGDEKGAALILSGGDPSGDDLNIEYSSGEWILTGQGGDTYGIIYLSDKTENGGCVSDLESNSMYKISLDMKELGDCLFKSVSGVSDVQQDYLTSDYVKYIHYVVTDSSTSDTDPYLLFTLIGSGEKVYIKNISVKKIEGNPGRTLQMNASSQSTDVPT